MKWRGKEGLSERIKKEMKGINACGRATITLATTKMTNVHYIFLVLFVEFFGITYLKFQQMCF